MRVSLPDTTQFLRSQCGSQVTDVVPIGGGAWSDAFSFMHDATEYVIRWSEHSENFERDALAASHSRLGLPVPEILDLGREAGHFYAISRFVEGEFFELLSVHELGEALQSILDMFAALRSVNLDDRSGYGTWDGTGNGQHGSWREFLLDIKNDPPGSLIAGWRSSLAESSVGFGAFDRLYARLESVVDFCPDYRHLIHSDLINRNVLVGGGQVRAVLDWGSSNYGDPLYDIAWIIFYEPWYPNFQAINLPGLLLEEYKANPASDAKNVEYRLLACFLHIGLDSISYNAFQRRWNLAQEVADYAEYLVSRYS